MVEGYQAAPHLANSAFPAHVSHAESAHPPAQQHKPVWRNGRRNGEKVS